MPDISPLFAVEAEKLLSEGKTDDAIELCEKGILVYPKYPVALSILARAYRIKGEIHAAKEKLAIVEQFRPNYKAIEVIKTQIDNPNFDFQISNNTITEHTAIQIDEPSLSDSETDDITDVSESEINNISVEDSQNESENFDINPEDIDALFEDSPSESSNEIEQTEVNDYQEAAEEAEDLSLSLENISDDLYDEDTPDTLSYSLEIGSDLASELESLISDIEEESLETDFIESKEEIHTNQEQNIPNDFDTINSETQSDYDVSSELNDLEYDEDLEGISEEIDLEISDIDDISDYSKESTYSIVDVAIEKEKLDTSKLPKNAKMSQLLDNSVSSIRANDLSLIPGLLTSPLQSDNSNKCHNYSEQLLPAYPPFPDSVSVNAITSTLGNNEIDQSIDLDEVTIDRSGAEDSFSRLADKIKNLSMPRIEAPNYEPEDEDYSPPSIITPTIANLLAMQGRVNEAIDAYEKLIIDDPENSSSYLSQIESLKNK